MLELIYKNPYTIELDLTEVTSTLGISIDDYTQIVFMVKSKKKDLDEDAKLVKTLEGGGIFLNDSMYYVLIESNDYELLVSNKTYVMAIGISYFGSDSLRELEILDGDIIKILPDTIRE